MMIEAVIWDFGGVLTTSPFEAFTRFETERGRLPRAMEFFKWRAAALPDSPSQATVYKLFPGGWDGLLAQLEDDDDAV